MIKRLLLLLAALTLLVACGGQSAVPTTETGEVEAEATPMADEATPATDAPAATEEATPALEEPAVTEEPAATEPVTLRVLVSLDAEAQATYEKGLAAVDEAHPEWTLELETVPQSGRLERITTAIASNTLPDVVLVDGLSAQQWIRQGAFLDLTPYIAEDDFDLSAFYEEPVQQFVYDERVYGIPSDAATEVVYYNKDMFDAAGLDYPTDDWTYEEMREAALLLTLDSEGRNATDPDFNPDDIVQWGWNTTPAHLWARHYVRAWGADWCANADCTLLDMTSPEVVSAMRWWADLAQEDHVAPYDPYSGAQTGVPGDPFTAGQAAMGFNNIAFTAQLNEQTDIRYDVVQPFKGVDGNRYGPISVRGYVISANTEHPDAAWELVKTLTGEDFLTEYWGKPGHAIPARRSAAPSSLNPDLPPENQEAALQAMEYETVFRPFTASAFEAMGKTAGLFTEAMKGDRPLEEVLAEIEQTANEVLASDRE